MQSIILNQSPVPSSAVCRGLCLKGLPPLLVTAFFARLRLRQGVGGGLAGDGSAAGGNACRRSTTGGGRRALGGGEAAAGAAQRVLEWRWQVTARRAMRCVTVEKRERPNETLWRVIGRQATAACIPPPPPRPVHRPGQRVTKTAFESQCVRPPLTLQQHSPCKSFPCLTLWQVRVRPLLAREKLEQATSCVTSLSDKQIILGSDRAFTFDRA